MRRAFAALLVLVALPAGAVPVETKLPNEHGHENAQIGHALATDGTTLVVGARSWGPDIPLRRGAAFVYEHGPGGWAEVAVLGRPRARTDERLGAAAAVRGDLMILGAPGFSSSKGIAHAYRRIDGTWTPDEYGILLPGGGAFDSFGGSVAIRGDDMVVIGEPGHDGAPGSDSGRAHVYAWRLQTVEHDWEHEQTLTGGDTGAGDGFGHRVAIDGDTLVVTAPLHWVGADRPGAAYVFRWEGDAWVEQQKLTPWYTSYVPEFGQSVAIDGDVIVIGAPRQVVDSTPSVGMAFVFRWNGTSWQNEATLGTPEPRAFGFFGISCAVSGDAIVVGEDDDTNHTPGKAYVFQHDGSHWWREEILAPSDGEASDRFGIAVAMSGGTAFVGADGDDGYTGAAYVYEDVTDPPQPAPTEEFLLPLRMEVTPPTAKRTQPGTFTAEGWCDLGAALGDLASPGVLTVGARTYAVPGLAAVKGGKVWRHAGEDVTVELRPMRTGSSRARFELAAAGLQPGDVPQDGEVGVAYAVGETDIACRVRLAAGVFKLGKRTGDLLEPAFCPVKMTCKVKGGGRDSVKLTGALGGDAPVPASPPDVTLRLGDAFAATVPGSALTRRGDRLLIRTPVAGLRKLVLDYRKRRFDVVAKRVDLGTIGEDRTVRIEIEIGGEAHVVLVRAALKGRALRY